MVVKRKSKGAVVASDASVKVGGTTPKTRTLRSVDKKPVAPVVGPRGKQLKPALRGQKRGRGKSPASTKRGGKKQTPDQEDSDEEEEEEEEDVKKEDTADNMEDDDDENDEDTILDKIRKLREASKNDEGQQKSGTVLENKEQAQAAANKTQKQPVTPQKEEVEESPQVPPMPEESDEAERDKRTLFIKNLLPDVTEDDVRTLSKDIKAVRMRVTIRSRRRRRQTKGFAYLEFSSEAVAEKNYKKLQGAKLKDLEVFVDYVGEKALKGKAKDIVSIFDPLRLYIAGLGDDVHEGDLNRLFPEAQGIDLPRRHKDKSVIGYAFASFATEEQCSTALESSEGVSLKGHKIVVSPAFKRFGTNQKGKDSEEKTEPPAKKAKTSIGDHGGDNEAADEEEEEKDREEEKEDDEEEDDEEDNDDEENGDLGDDKEEDDDDEEDDSDDED